MICDIDRTYARFFPKAPPIVNFLSERDCVVPSARIVKVLRAAKKENVDVYVMPKLGHTWLTFHNHWIREVCEYFGEDRYGETEVIYSDRQSWALTFDATSYMITQSRWTTECRIAPSTSLLPYHACSSQLVGASDQRSELRTEYVRSCHHTQNEYFDIESGTMGEDTNNAMIRVYRKEHIRRPVRRRGDDGNALTEVEKCYM